MDSIFSIAIDIKKNLSFCTTTRPYSDCVWFKFWSIWLQIENNSIFLMIKNFSYSYFVFILALALSILCLWCNLCGDGKFFYHNHHHHHHRKDERQNFVFFAYAIFHFLLRLFYYSIWLWSIHLGFPIDETIFLLIRSIPPPLHVLYCAWYQSVLITLFKSNVSFMLEPFGCRFALKLDWQQQLLTKHIV